MLWHAKRRREESTTEHAHECVIMGNVRNRYARAYVVCNIRVRASRVCVRAACALMYVRARVCM